MISYFWYCSEGLSVNGCSVQDNGDGVLDCADLIQRVLQPSISESVTHLTDSADRNRPFDPVGRLPPKSICAGLAPARDSRIPLH